MGETIARWRQRSGSLKVSEPRTAKDAVTNTPSPTTVSLRCCFNGDETDFRVANYLLCFLYTFKIHLDKAFKKWEYKREMRLHFVDDR